MNAARRGYARRDWPKGLKMPREGYYSWTGPDGKTRGIGRVPLAEAIAQAAAANAWVQANKPTLLDKLQGKGTVTDLMALMPVSESANTRKSHRSLDKKIAAKLGKRQVTEVTVRDCADLIDGIAKTHQRTAESIRSRLIALFKKAQAKGWVETNPALVTERPQVKVARGRLTLETFRAIYAKAPEVNEWLQRAMMLALVTGQDRSTVCAMERRHVQDDCLIVRRSKTGNAVAIPLSLRLDVVNVSIQDLISYRSGVVSPFLLHHVRTFGNAPAGSRVFPDAVSKAFTKARELAGIPDDGAPTFHELRSLSKRLYVAQGGIDTKALLGHSTEKMGDLYADPRGVEPVRVNVKMVR